MFEKKRKRTAKSNYSNTKVKARNLLTNVSCRRIKQKDYNSISNPKLTYQKANAIVKNFIEEDVNRINLLKYKIEPSFNLIHYIY